MRVQLICINPRGYQVTQTKSPPTLLPTNRLSRQSHLYIDVSLAKSSPGSLGYPAMNFVTMRKVRGSHMQLSQLKYHATNNVNRVVN